MRHTTHKVKKMTIDPGLKKELDALVVQEQHSKRWTDEAEAVLIHYYTETDVSVTTVCKILAKAFPKKDWPYAIVNGKIQYLRRQGCFGSVKGVK